MSGSTGEAEVPAEASAETTWADTAGHSNVVNTGHSSAPGSGWTWDVVLVDGHGGEETAAEESEGDDSELDTIDGEVDGTGEAESVEDGLPALEPSPIILGLHSILCPLLFGLAASAVAPHPSQLGRISHPCNLSFTVDQYNEMIQAFEVRVETEAPDDGGHIDDAEDEESDEGEDDEEDEDSYAEDGREIALVVD